jgi:hypothetical protein
MKRLILLIMTCIPLLSVAQDQALMEKYSSIDGCATIELSKEMIRSMGGGDGIDTLSAISIESEALISDFNKEVAEYAKGMTQILSVMQNSQRVKIYCVVDDNTNKITKMLIHTTDSHKAVMVVLTGKDIEISNVSSIMDMKI